MSIFARSCLPGLAAALIAASAAAAGGGTGPELALPLLCAPGRDCWIANYVDGDPSDGARDYACGRMTYNGHSGTDFAIRDLQAMAEGVPVLAAAAGVVRGVRDGEADLNIRERDRSAVKGRECGNGVRIEHPGGWTTQYCHLRQGSVSVKPGAQVSAGTPLGLVGLSGQTEFPHVHFAVRLGTRTIDPFLGLDSPAGCGAGPAPLWNRDAQAALPYARGAIYNFGIATEIPRSDAAQRGEYRALRISPGATRIAIWAEILGTAPGDAIEFELSDPAGGGLLAKRLVVARTQARIFRWVAIDRPSPAWPAGKYHGKITYSGTENPPRTLSTAEFVVDVRQKPE